MEFLHHWLQGKPWGLFREKIAVVLYFYCAFQWAKGFLVREGLPLPLSLPSKNTQEKRFTDVIAHLICVSSIEIPEMASS